jgi:hypothetical protein
MNMYKTFLSKISPNILAHYLTLMPKINNLSKGENSPNLVTLFLALKPGLERRTLPGTDPTTSIYNATSSLARSENKNILFYLEKCSSLLQR